MTEESADDMIVLMEYGKVREANGWYVLERTPGAKQCLAYGPMPEEAIPAFIEALKQSAMIAANQAADRIRENLAVLMRSDEERPKRIKHGNQKESSSEEGGAEEGSAAATGPETDEG